MQQLQCYQNNIVWEDDIGNIHRNGKIIITMSNLIKLTRGKIQNRNHIRYKLMNAIGTGIVIGIKNTRSNSYLMLFGYDGQLQRELPVDGDFADMYNQDGLVYISKIDKGKRYIDVFTERLVFVRCIAYHIDADVASVDRDQFILRTSTEFKWIDSSGFAINPRISVPSNVSNLLYCNGKYYLLYIKQIGERYAIYKIAVVDARDKSTHTIDCGAYEINLITLGSSEVAGIGASDIYVFAVGKIGHLAL